MSSGWNFPYSRTDPLGLLSEEQEDELLGALEAEISDAMETVVVLSPVAAAIADSTLSPTPSLGFVAEPGPSIVAEPSTCGAEPHSTTNQPSTRSVTTTKATEDTLPTSPVHSGPTVELNNNLKTSPVCSGPAKLSLAPLPTPIVHTMGPTGATPANTDPVPSTNKAAADLTTNSDINADPRSSPVVTNDLPASSVTTTTVTDPVEDQQVSVTDDNHHSPITTDLPADTPADAAEPMDTESREQMGIDNGTGEAEEIQPTLRSPVRAPSPRRPVSLRVSPVQTEVTKDDPTPTGGRPLHKEPHCWVDAAVDKRVDDEMAKSIDNQCTLCPVPMYSSLAKRLKIHLYSHFVTFVCAAGCGLTGFSKDHVTRHRRRAKPGPCGRSTTVYAADEAGFEKMIEETRVLPKGTAFPRTRLFGPAALQQSLSDTQTWRRSSRKRPAPKRRKTPEEPTTTASTADHMVVTDQLKVVLHRNVELGRRVETPAASPPSQRRRSRVTNEGIQVSTEEIPSEPEDAPTAPNHRERRHRRTRSSPEREPPKKAKRKHRETSATTREEPGPSHAIGEGERLRNRRRNRLLRAADSAMSTIRTRLEEKRARSDSEQEELDEQAVQRVKDLLRGAMMDSPPHK